MNQSEEDRVASHPDPDATSDSSGEDEQALVARFYDAITGGIYGDLVSPEAEHDDDMEDDGLDEEDDDFEPEEDIIFHDAESGELGVEVVFEDDSDDDNARLEEESDEDGEEAQEDDDDEEDEDEDEAGNDDQATEGPRVIRLNNRAGVVTRAQLWRLLQNRDLSQLLQAGVDSDDEYDDFEPQVARRRALRRRSAREPIKPSEEGTKLLRSGYFGSNEYGRRMKKHFSRRLLDREQGLGRLEDRKRNSGLLTQDLLPGTRADQILHYDEPVYSGQFSDDGNFYFSVCQDFRVRMYDTSNPFEWKHYKTAAYPWGHWTLTDASLSPDNKWIAYSSHSSLVSIAPTDPLDRGDPYTLDLEAGPHANQNYRRMNFSVFSVRFSGDGRELVAGTRQNSLVIYDIESRRVLHTIDGHENDVNAVCFADKDSPHILYSGSDDATLKVWDRRTLGDSREAGAFVGHNEGLTYIDSKGDGRYILSNGKDQTAKLWDLRMALSSSNFRNEDMAQWTRNNQHDYRFVDELDYQYQKHPHDNSVVTFRGHKVMRTLIRCHFSPQGSTDSRYVYTGSSDGRVHIYNMDATIAKVIDVGEATKGTRRRDGYMRYYAYEENGSWESLVRDVSWHPTAPVLAASAWNAYNMARGTTSVHSFTGSRQDEGEPPMGRSYNAKMQREEDLYDAKYGDMVF